MAIEVVLPMLGVTVERGKIVEWIKKEGDTVEKGEIIFIVEVEKATTEVESPASGILAKIILTEGVEAPVLALAAVITEPGEELPEEYAGEIKTPEVSEKPETDVKEATAPAPAEDKVPADPKDLIAVPAARQLAKEQGLELSDIKGTGPGGVIMVSDVEAGITTKQPAAESGRASTLARKMAAKEGVELDQVEGTGVRGRIMRADISAYLEKAASAGPALGEIIPMSAVRKVIARKMSESAFTAPHIYFYSEICLDPLLKFRKEVVPEFEKYFGLRPSINDFLIKAVALNILDFPIMNAQLEGDDIHIMPDVNVGLAVAVDEGLIVPAIAGAERAGLVDIARQRVDLVEKARNGKLSLPEMQRGTFTVSSLAQFDITFFTSIINPPQSAILSVGKTDEKLYMSDGEVKVKRVTQMGLAVDHRVIDGAVAADFLQNLKWKIEKPTFTFLTI